MFSTFRGQGSKDTTPGSQRRDWTTSAGLLSYIATPPTNLCQVQIPPLSPFFLYLTLSSPWPHTCLSTLFSRLPFCALRNRLFLDCSLLHWSIYLGAWYAVLFTIAFYCHLFIMWSGLCLSLCGGRGHLAGVGSLHHLVLRSEH